MRRLALVALAGLIAVMSHVWRSQRIWVQRPLDAEMLAIATVICASPLFFDPGKNRPIVTLGDARYVCGPDEIRFEIRIQRKDV